MKLMERILQAICTPMAGSVHYIGGADTLPPPMKGAEEQAALIAQDPNYGEVVCRCETVTKAEVLQAINNPLGVHTVTGVKYRCRTMMGRCQGGYCQTRVTEMIMQETGCSREEVTYSRDGSWMFTGKVRDGQ